MKKAFAQTFAIIIIACALILVSGAQNASNSTINALCTTYDSVNTAIFILGLTLILLGGSLYAGSRFLPATNSGNMQGYAMGMILGGVIGIIIAVLAPFVFEVIVGNVSTATECLGVTMGPLTSIVTTAPTSTSTTSIPSSIPTTTISTTTMATLPTTTPSTTATTIPYLSPKIYGTIATLNMSAVEYSIANGAKNFRFGIIDSGEQEQQMATYHKQGADILGIGFPIIFSSGTVCGLNGTCPYYWNITQYNDSIPQTLIDYPYISEWEIDNEPYTHLTGFENGSAYNYFLMIKDAAIIVKRIEPNATIICFGGAAIGNAAELAWYTQVWNYGAAKYCDAISIHAYPNMGTFSSSTPQVWENSLNQYEALTGKPIWITETGVTNNNANQNLTTQAHFLNESFSFLGNQSDVQRIYWYNLYGLSDNPPDSNFSLLNITWGGTPYPDWYVYLKYAK